MAYGTTRTWVNTSKVDSALIPSTHTSETSPASISGVNLVAEQLIDFTVAKEDFENATIGTAFDDLVDDIDALVQTHIGTTLGIDTSGNTVDYNAEITSIIAYETKTDLLKPSASLNFAIKVKLKVKVS